jgi:predicted transcriptional regulator of viral defense system
VKRDPQENIQRLYPVAEAQGGYFTAAQAHEAGYTYAQQHFHVTRGNWLRADRGIFRLPNFPPHEHEDLIRLSLWSRTQRGSPQAVVSHTTALVLHELSDVLPATVHLTVPPGFRKPAPSGCVLHHANLRPADIEEHTGYRVTTPLRTLLDVAASALSQEHLDQAVTEALVRGMVRREVLEDVAEASPAQARLEQALAVARHSLELPR